MSESKVFMVAFSSPKRAASVVNVAATHARAFDAELVLVRVIPDAGKVGVVAQLITTDRPQEKAQAQIDMVVAALKEKGIKARGLVKVGEVAGGLAEAARELKAEMVYVGTSNPGKGGRFYMPRDPIVHFLVDNLDASLCMVRSFDPVGSTHAFFKPPGEGAAPDSE